MKLPHSVITVRLPCVNHHQLKIDAESLGLSLNQLCCQLLQSRVLIDDGTLIGIDSLIIKRAADSPVG